MASITVICDVAMATYRLCQEASDTKAALKEVEQKLLLVAHILQSLPKHVPAPSLAAINTCITSIQSTIVKARAMSKVVYLIKTKDIRSSLTQEMDRMHSFLLSLEVDQNSSLYEKIGQLQDQWGNIELDDTFQKQMNLEQKQAQELRQLIQRPGEQQFDVADMQRRGLIAPQDDLHALIDELFLELDRLYKESSSAKAQMEAQYMEQIVQFFRNNVPTNTPCAPPTVNDLPDSCLCPVSAEIMLDPVCVDSASCRCVVDRTSFQRWVQQNGNNTCPVCLSLLRSSQVFPQPQLADMIRHIIHAQMPNSKSASVESQLDYPRNISATPTAHPIAPLEESTRALGQNNAAPTESQSPTMASRRAARSYTPGSVEKPARFFPSVAFPSKWKYEGSHVMNGHSSFVSCCSEFDDGNKILSGSFDNTLKVWDTASGACLQTLIGHSGSVRCCAVFEGGIMVLSGGGDRTLKAWDVITGACLQTLKGHADYVWCCTVLSGGQKVLSGSGDRTLKIWDVTNGSCLRTLKGHLYAVTCCAVLGDGTQVLSGSDDCTLKIWDVVTGHCLKTLPGHTDSIRCCSVFENGGKVVSGSADKELKVWNLGTGKCEQTLTGHLEAVSCCAVLDGGCKVLSGSDDHTMKIWDISTGAFLKTLDGLSNTVACCTMLEGGGKILSGSDKILKVWVLKSTDVENSYR